MDNKIILHVISTTDPEYDGKENLVPDYFSSWYLHGKLEELFHYDIASFYGDFPKSFLRRVPVSQDGSLVGLAHIEGEYQVDVHGVPEKARGFFWIIPRGTQKNPQGIVFPVWQQRGLVVLESDSEGLEYARKKFQEKAKLL